MRLLAFALAVMMAFPAFGSTGADSVKVYFRVGHRQFDPTLGENRAAMERFVGQVREAEAAGDIERIVVRAYASPDGLNKANQLLSVRRCEVIADYIATHTGVSPTRIKTEPGGIAWDELRQLVVANPNVPSREKVLDILDHTPIWIFNSAGQIVDGRKKQLMDLGRGVPYRWMLVNLFPELRNSVAVSLYVTSKDASRSGQIGQRGQASADPTDPTGTAGTVGGIGSAGAAGADKTDKTDTPAGLGASEKPDGADKSADSAQTAQTDRSDKSAGADRSDRSERSGKSDSSEQAALLQPSAVTDGPSAAKPHYFALKTNLLYDAALIPNIGAEFYLGRNLSVYGDWMHAWWSSNHQHRYYRIYGGDVGLRWWFGRKAHEKPLTGHHAGVYAGAFTFDMEFGGRGYMGGLPGGNLLDRCFINGGIEYGYSLPVSKRLNLDFSIGLGYVAGKYMEYIPEGFEHGYLWQTTKRFGWFGPTKAEISLVWLLGRGNANAKKGGGK